MTRQVTPKQPAFRAYRAAAMNTGPANVGADIVWDTVQEAHGIDVLADGIFKPLFNGFYDARVQSTIASGSSWQEFRLILEIDPGGGFAARERAHVSGTNLLGVLGGSITMGRGTAPLIKELNVLANQQMRCRVITIGTSNVPLVVGPADTWISFIRLGPLRAGG